MAGVTALDIDVLHLWRVMWWGVWGPVFLLLGMIVYTLTVASDRIVRYYAARSQSYSFARQASQALVEGALTQIVSIAPSYRKSPIAAMLAAALENLGSLAPHISDPEAIPAARRALKSSAVNIHAELKQGLNGLATVATVAPLLGMSGTVFHLAFGAFPGCGAQKSACEAAEASRVGDSLLSCVLGAFVGVLALWCYRYFSSRVEDFDAEMNHSSQAFIHSLILHPAWSNQSRP
jgi:biopolymer transport protein ExbB/TolQ